MIIDVQLKQEILEFKLSVYTKLDNSASWGTFGPREIISSP